MSSIKISLIVFVLVFGAALFGIFLHAALPGDYFREGTKEVVRLGRLWFLPWLPWYSGCWSPRQKARMTRKALLWWKTPRESFFSTAFWLIMALDPKARAAGTGIVTGTMAFDRKQYGMNSGIPFIKIADRVEVDLSLKVHRLSGPPVNLK